MKRALPFALLLTACEASPIAPSDRAPLDLAPVADGQALLGAARDDDAFVLLVAGAGLVRVDDDGAVVERIAPGERGLQPADYKDVAALGDGRYLLLADGEGHLYDAANETQRIHFCVEPGFEEPIPGEPPPVEPVLVQRNDALAVDGDLVVAGPRFYASDTGELVESSLRSYRASDGVPLGVQDATPLALELDGLAIVGDEVWGAQGARLHRFARADGAHLGESGLDGVERVAGLAVDDDIVWVLDAARAVLAPYAR